MTPLDLTQVGTGWPLALSMAAVTAARGLAAGRRRTALNEAVHELRRPLQVLALADAGADERVRAGSLQLAAVALERLEGEINGGGAEAVWTAVPVGPLLEGAVIRWGGLASRVGASVRLSRAAEATIRGDRWELAQALDNLIANAIEHGGPEVSVGAELTGASVRIAVADSGPGARSRRGSAASLLRRLGGRRRHGHGLRVVRRIAIAHGGEFRAPRRGAGEAVLELPLLAVADR